MKFFDLLTNLYGFDLHKKGKVILARHKLDKDEPELESHIRHSRKNFEEWQCIQRKENKPQKGKAPSRNKGAVFWGCDIVVSFCGAEFYGEKGEHARFVGIYRNHSNRQLPKKLNIKRDLSPELARIYGKREKEPRYFFDFRHDAKLKDLEERVVVNWPYGARNWAYQYQKASRLVRTSPKELEVQEILRRGYVRPFPGIENFTLSFADLQEVVKTDEWKEALSIAGIYAIRYDDGNKSQLYIGSASGKNGIIQRWQNYAKGRLGNNKKLGELLQKNPDAVRDFKFSVLQALSPSLSNKQVIAKESLWKEKLGSRDSLNSN